jgi:predicted trehalose synthase
MPHLDNFAAMIQSPINAIGDEVWSTRFHDEALAAILDEIGSSGASGREYRKAAGESFQQHQAEAFSYGWEDEHVRGLIGRDEFGSADGRSYVNLIAKRAEEFKAIDHAPAHGQVHIIPVEQAQCL